ncbi:MAG: hypothetical protein HYY24_18450 [Verrucomicrobia bacterium]|nr:hypothetical protein [Verrucomicrobiota bacterium]
MNTSKTRLKVGRLLSTWLVLGFGAFCSAVDHSPKWTGATQLSYGLLDLDGFDPKTYYYCNWGNPMKTAWLHFPSPGVQWCTFSWLTQPPFNNSNADLFLSDSTVFRWVAFPANAGWTAPTGAGTDGDGALIFPAASDSVRLFRYLHFRNQLFDAASWLPVGASTKKLIILIHGWNPNSKRDSFDTDSFRLLENKLRFALTGSDWNLVKYHWEPDADTGPLDWSLAANPTEAAEISHQHGQHLGELLSALCPNLEKVQLIAHSAGTWAARSTARYLLERAPKVIVQITLLDPFMPSAVGANSTLGRPVMDGADSMPGRERMFLLENYYSVELTFGTDGNFAWRTEDLNLQVDWLSSSLVSYYNYHDGPIDWYTDTIYAAYSTTVPVALASFEFQLTRVGWQRSLFFNEPVLTSNPQSVTVNAGQNINLQVSATTRFRGRNGLLPTGFAYQWQKNGQNVLGATSGFLQIPSARLADAGQYSVVVSNPAGSAVSATATVVVKTPTRPRLAVLCLASGTLEIRVTGDAGATYRLEASADLRTWMFLKTGLAPTGSVTFTEKPPATEGHRFYRAVAQP